MNCLKVNAAVCLIVSLAACGGGTPGSPISSPPAATTYSFVVPAVNAQRVYASTIVDNSSNTINLTYTETVTAINSNGTHTLQIADPSNNVVTVNGTSYSIANVTVTANGSDQILASLNNVTQITCTYSPYGAGPSFPISINTEWSNAYTETCGSNAPVSFTQTGAVIDVESVTVPAGVFSALKLFNIINYTDANGTTRNQAYTTWRDAKTGVTVKQQVLTSYSGTALTNGYPVSNTIVLQSGTP